MGMGLQGQTWLESGYCIHYYTVEPRLAEQSWDQERLTTQNQLSVQIPRGKLAKNEPSLIRQINILKDTVKWH